MSRFFSRKYEKLIAYTPGEQPKDTEYVKLNTNESPFPPSEKAVAYAEKAARALELYPDPECLELREKLASLYGVDKDEVILGNGSDEVLNFAFMAFCDDTCPAVFPDITYGFYKVFADVNTLPYVEIPLREDFTIDTDEYLGNDKTIFIANPNAPTGIMLTRAEIEKVLKANPDRIVVVDEAYVDFGGESSVSLIHQYDNLLVTQTFSKSRSMAGARLGMGFASKEIIRDLNTVRYSTNPYNINRMTMAAALGILEDEESIRENCRTIMENRAYISEKLKTLGFVMTDSFTNFIFAKHPEVSGEKIYLELKKRGVLVRHFTVPEITDYNRITVGTKEQMDILYDTLKTILEELK